jgi:amidase
VDTTSAEFQAVLQQNEYFAGDGGIPGTLKAHQLDLIVTPAMCGPTVFFAARADLPIVVVPLEKYPEGTDVKYVEGGPERLVDVAPGIP